MLLIPSNANWICCITDEKPLGYKTHSINSCCPEFILTLSSNLPAYNTHWKQVLPLCISWIVFRTGCGITDIKLCLDPSCLTTNWHGYFYSPPIVIFSKMLVHFIDPAQVQSQYQRHVSLFPCFAPNLRW